MINPGAGAMVQKIRRPCNVVAALVPRAGGTICTMTNAVPTAKTKIATTMDGTIWATVSALMAFSQEASPRSLNMTAMMARTTIQPSANEDIRTNRRSSHSFKRRVSGVDVSTVAVP
jgi:hypothetical protein